jgi:hypothetical protein
MKSPNLIHRSQSLALLVVIATSGCGANSDANGDHGTSQATGGAASSSGGSTADSGGSQTNGGTGADGTVRTLGQQCNTPGSLACAGISQQDTLVCASNHTWQPDRICASTQVCDPTPGSTQGTCQAQDPLCATAPAGQQFCSGYAEWICDTWAMKATKVRDCPIGAWFDGTCADPSACLTFGNFLSCTDDCVSILDATQENDSCNTLTFLLSGNGALYSEDAIYLLNPPQFTLSMKRTPILTESRTEVRVPAHLGNGLTFSQGLFLARG